jgi:hypothetical protein
MNGRFGKTKIQLRRRVSLTHDAASTPMITLKIRDLLIDQLTRLR